MHRKLADPKVQTVVGLCSEEASSRRIQATKLFRTRSCNCLTKVVEGSNRELHHASVRYRALATFGDQTLPIVLPCPSCGEQKVGKKLYQTWQGGQVPREPSHNILAKLLRQLHTNALLDERLDSLALPRITIKGIADSLLLYKWSDNVAEFTESIAMRLSSLHARVHDDLEYSNVLQPVHGDAHQLNYVLVDGRPVLCDLDTLTIGDARVDLLPTMLEPDRWGRPLKVAEEFSSSYGNDVREDPHFSLIREVWEWEVLRRMEHQVPFGGRRRKRQLRALQDLLTESTSSCWYE